MVTHTRNWHSAFNPSKCTHTAVSSDTHCENTPGAVGSHCSSARGAIGGSAPNWRWRECCSFTIPTFNPCWTWDSYPQPLDYKSDSLTIRPRLPYKISILEWFLKDHATLRTGVMKFQLLHFKIYSNRKQLFKIVILLHSISLLFLMYLVPLYNRWP